MADPLEYTLVRLDNNIPDKAVLTYDAPNDKITDSGLTAEYGELQAGADSVTIGLQTMSSAGEQVVWENAHSSVVYAPPWHVIDETNTEGSRDRLYGTLQTAVVFSDKSGELSNPTMLINVPENGIVFSYTLDFPVARNNVEFALTYEDPRNTTKVPHKEIWREIRDVSAGENENTLTIPNALYVGTYYFSIRNVDPADDPVIVKGNAQTGEIAYSVRFRPFREVPLATKEYVDSAVTGGDTTNFMLKSAYDTDDDGKVNLAVAADTAAQLTGVQGIQPLHYYGKDADGNVGFHLLPAISGGVDGIFDDLATGDIPSWDDTANKLKPSGIRKVAGQTLVDPSGFYLGDVGLSTDSHGLLISPLTDPKVYRALMQSLTANSDAAFVRSYNGAQEKVISDATIDTLKDPQVSFSVDKDTTLISMAIRTVEALKELTVSFLNKAGDTIWKEHFFTLDAGGNTLTLATPPDILSSEAVTIAFSGVSYTDNFVQLEGKGSTPYLKINLMQWEEKKIATEDYVTSGVGPLEDKVDDADLKIDTLITRTANLANNIAELNRYFVYRGKVAPTFPVVAQSGYFNSLYALTKREVITLPNPTGLHDGSHFFLRNEDKNNSVRLEAPTGITIKGGSALNVPPQNTVWLIHNGNDWLELMSGYLPSSYNTFLSDIKSYLSTDTTFLKALGVQNDDPNAAPLEVSTLEFHGCDVEHDPNNADKAFVSPRLGVDFINPDNTRINKVTEVKLVGMEIKDPKDGTPPKLILLDHNSNPQPSTASAYAFFDAAAIVPDTVDFQSLPVFRGGRVTVHKGTTNPEYAYILIPPGEDHDAERIGELGGIPSYWSKQSKVYTIGGQQRTYVVFRSPYPFHETDVTLVIYP